MLGKNAKGGAKSIPQKILKKLKKGKAKPWNTQNFTSPQALPSSKKISLC